MTVVNPKSISGINSITMASGSDNLLTIHTTNTTERVRVNSDGDVIVGSGITVSPDGDIFATGVTTSTTFVGALTGNVTGNISGGTVAGSTGTFTGNVAVSGANITLQDSGSASDDRIALGADGDLQLFHDATNSVISNQTGDLYIENDSSSTSEKIYIRAKAGESSINCNPNAGVELYYNDGKKAETLTNGFSVTGSCYATNSGAGSGTSQIELQPYGTDAYLNVTASNSFYTRLGTSYTIRTQIDSSGNFHVNTGNLVIGTSGKGIDFSATSGPTNGSDSSELLDDYEEGTWTATMQDGNGSTVNLTSQDNSYTKIGRIVHVQGNFTLDDTGKSGEIVLKSLPYNGLAGSQLASGHFWVDRGTPGNDTIGGVMYKTAGNARAYFVNPTLGGSGGSSPSQRYFQFGDWAFGRPIYFSLTYQT